MMLIILKDRKFVAGPEEAYRIGGGFELEERCSKAIDNARAVHAREKALGPDVAFDNLVFLGFVEAEILEEIEMHGISELV